MKNELTTQDFKNIAAQLRKPEGEAGRIIAEKMNEGNKSMNLHTIAVLNPEPNDQILEIGMGNGLFVKNIVAMSSSIRYTGVDYSETMIQQASEINNQFIVDDRVNFVKADIQNLPFPSAAFTKIVTVNTFYFWEDHSLVLLELKRVLKPNGQLILAVRPKENLEKFPVTNYGFSKHSNDEIIALLKSNGFSAIEITEIKEPTQESFVGGAEERETLILNCKL
ncbi:class I SAM-dependent methyltransferase [Aquimarina agarivorans]|uniref:class I SAM-dependent methyltransferase n=1 Tax=Aquimarina agarivorans TaxID=980584 RepID=UPI000248EABC|nr:class I SAM-dependent methyltransferase [Aquimarina agarivorans]